EGPLHRRDNRPRRRAPGAEAARAPLDRWRRRGPDGAPAYDLTDPDLDTRFLADLYQEVSEPARKAYALLHTPDFVVDLLLDLTLEPAVEEFGLEPDLEVRADSGRSEARRIGKDG